MDNNTPPPADPASAQDQNAASSGQPATTSPPPAQPVGGVWPPPQGQPVGGVWAPPTTQPVGGAWPPPRGQPTSGVWPPPPTPFAFSSFPYPFKAILSRVGGTCANFRVGSLQVSEHGLHIEGKAIRPYEKQWPLLLLLLFTQMGFLIGAIVLEYAFRLDDRVDVPWTDVDEIVTVDRKRIIGILYRAPNYKGRIKLFSLATKLDPGLYEQFKDAARTHLGERLHPGRLRMWTSMPAWIVIGVLCAIVLLSVIRSIAQRSLGGAQ